MNTFDVTGFGCGQCIKVTLLNLDIGPQNQNIPVLGRYTHARAIILPRLKYLNIKIILLDHHNHNTGMFFCVAIFINWKCNFYQKKSFFWENGHFEQWCVNLKIVATCGSESE